MGVSVCMGVVPIKRHIIYISKIGHNRTTQVGGTRPAHQLNFLAFGSKACNLRHIDLVSADTNSFI